MREHTTYQQGWTDARQHKYEFCPDNVSSEYREGFQHGVIAREQADNYNFDDYYRDH